MYALAYISVVVHEYDFGSVVLNKFAPFYADRVRHHYYCAVSAHRSYEGKADALIAACRLNDHRAGPYNACLFGRFYHLICCSCLDGSADIEPFEFDQDFCICRRIDVIEAYHRSVAQRLKNIVIDHNSPQPFPINNYKINHTIVQLTEPVRQ